MLGEFLRLSEDFWGQCSLQTASEVRLEFLVQMAEEEERKLASTTGCFMVSDNFETPPISGLGWQILISFYCGVNFGLICCHNWPNVTVLPQNIPHIQHPINPDRGVVYST